MNCVLNVTEEEVCSLSNKLKKFFLSHGAHMEDDALDLTQDTFLRVLQKVEDGEQVLSLEGFTIGIAKNVFREYCHHIEKANRHDCITGLELVGSDHPLKEVLSADRQVIFQEVFELLPKGTQTLLTKRFIEGVPSRKIAKEEGVTAGVIDLRVFRAKLEIKKSLNKKIRKV